MEKHALSPKTLKIIYFVVIIFCVVAIALMIIFMSISFNKNQRLKKEADAIVEKYKIEATDHNNKNDPDYAEVYFDDNVIYIPNDNIIIEFHP